MCCSSRGIVALGILLTAAAAYGQGSTGPSGTAQAGREWVVTLAALRDDDAYEHLAASFNIAVTDATWLFLTAGDSRAPSAAADVHASLLGIALEHDFGPLGIAVSVEDWGDENNLESRDLQGEIFIGGDDYRVALVSESRDIDIYFSAFGEPLPTDLRRLPIDADGLGLKWRIRLAPLWQTYGSWMDYDYPPRVRLVPRADRLDLLSTSAVTLAYGFIDEFATLGLERIIGSKLVNFDYGTDRGTIGGDRLTSVSGSVLWPVARRLDLEFTLGRSHSNGLGSTTFGGLTLLIYGGG